MSGLTGTHTAPQDDLRPGSSHLTPRRFLVEWLLLSAAMAAPYAVFGAKVGFFAALGVIGIYLNLPVHSQRNKPKRAPHSAGLAVSGYFIGFALVIPVLVGWFFAVFDLNRVGIKLEIPATLWIIFAAFTLSPLAIGIGSYIRSFTALRRNGLITVSFLNFIRMDLVSLPRSPFLIEGIGPSFALLGGVMLAASPIPVESLADTLIQTSATTILDIVRLMPTLPFGLLGISALYAVCWGSRQRASIVLTRLEGGTGHPLWQGAVATVGCFALMATLFQFYHVGMVAALSSVAGTKHWGATLEALPDWITDQRNKGLSASKIAAKLTEHGHWRLNDPGAGLAVLMPELGTELDQLGGKCEISIEAAPADPAAIAGANWIPAQIAQLDIKYCMRIDCPSPVRWHAPPSALLHSSHPSKNKYWLKSVYIDIHTNGVAAAPGGYCTVDGRLAKDFQG